MNNKKLNSKTKIINLGKNNIKESRNGIIKENNDNQKKVIESYITKNNDIQYMTKKLKLDTSTTFEKKNNLSLFYFLILNLV